MADTLESLEIKVVHSASGADAEIGKLASAIGSLKTAITGTPAALKELAAALKAVHESCKGGTAKFDKFAESMANVAASAEMLGDNSNSVMTLANAMSTLSEVKVTASSFNSLSSGVEKVGAAAKSVTPEAIENLDKMVTSLAKLQGVDLQGLGSAMSAVRRVGAAKEPEAKVPLTEDMQALISSASQIDVLEAKLMSLRDAMQEAFSAGDMDKAYSIRGQILQTEAALEKARAAAEGAGKATKEAAKGVKELSKEANKSKGPLDNFIGSLKRIAFYRFIRTIIKAITQAFQEGLQNAYAYSNGITTEGHRFSAALDSMSTAGLKMKNQLGSAFIGLLAAIAPIVNAIISLIVRLANALSQLFAAFTGRTYLKANDVSAQFADNMKKGAGAAKEWKNQLLGFDEINRLNEPSGGGGGGGSALSDYENMFDTVALDGAWKKLSDLFSKIKFNIKDVLFNWDDLNPENIAKKAIVGLSAILGAGVGFIIGGVPGSVIGTILGVGIGLIIDSIIFDNDRVLATNEVAKMLSAALFALVGGAVGFMVGGVGGALIGAAVGVGIYATLLGIDFFSGGGNHDVIRKLVPALATYAGFAIGFAIGGPGGAAIGATLGLGISFLLSSFAFSDTSHWGAAEYAAHIIAAIAPFVGAAIGFAVGGPGGALIGAMIGLGIHFLLTSESVVEGETIAERVFGPIVRWCQAAHAWIQDVIDGLFALGRTKPSNWQNNLTQDDYLAGFASGGFPSEGQLFMAREAGPELVGTVGGRTAVANNDQIVEGIRQGVYDAVLAANANNGGGGEFRLYLDSKQIKYGLERVDRAWGV